MVLKLACNLAVSWLELHEHFFLIDISTFILGSSTCPDHPKGSMPARPPNECVPELKMTNHQIEQIKSSNTQLETVRL